MNNMFGVVVKPIFDENIFKVGGPVVVYDYQNNVEFSAIITMTSPVFVEVLRYDKEINNGKFLKIHIDNFINGSFGLHPLVKQDVSNFADDVDDNVVDEKVLDIIEEVFEDSEENKVEENDGVEDYIDDLLCKSEYNPNIDDGEYKPNIDSVETSYEGVVDDSSEVCVEDDDIDNGYGDESLESYAKNYSEFSPNNSTDEGVVEQSDKSYNTKSYKGNRGFNRYNKKPKFNKNRE